jgi:hypothetical protein
MHTLSVQLFIPLPPPFNLYTRRIFVKQVADWAVCKLGCSGVTGALLQVLVY